MYTVNVPPLHDAGRARGRMDRGKRVLLLVAEAAVAAAWAMKWLGAVDAVLVLKKSAYSVLLGLRMAFTVPNTVHCDASTTTNHGEAETHCMPAWSRTCAHQGK